MSEIIILDGGMGRELKRMGAPFRQPEWSALALIEAPAFVERAHQAFVEAGADVITTNSYALVPFHIGEERFVTDGAALAARAGQIACTVAETAVRRPRVAGSLPPLFGSYRPDLFDPVRAPALLAPLIAGLRPHVDLWLAETQSSIAEARAIRLGLGQDPKPLWISFTLADGDDVDAATPTLRSGETVIAATQEAIDLGAAAILFNCSQPEVMGAAVSAAADTIAKSGTKIMIGVYANAFPPQDKEAKANDTLEELRADLDPEGYCGFVQDWIRRGATIIGGCCGIGPEHIAEIKRQLG